MKSSICRKQLGSFLIVSIGLVIFNLFITTTLAADISFGVEVGDTAIWRFPSNTNVIYEKQTCISKFENVSADSIHARFENYSLNTGASTVVDNQTYRYIEPVEWLAPGGSYEQLDWTEETITVKAGEFTCLRNDYSAAGEDGSQWYDKTTGLMIRWDYAGDMIMELVLLEDADLATLAEETEVPELRDHDPISIYTGSTNEVGYNGITRGSGTENDPYIIEWWNIVPRESNETNMAGIMFTGVDEYYLVANCSISGWSAEEWGGGISLDGVNHVDVKDCNITDCSIGINLLSAGSDSADMTIANNNIEDSVVNGIKLQRGQGTANWDCHRIIIKDNKIDTVGSTASGIEGNENGITVYSGVTCQITGNTIKSCANYGIYLENDPSNVYSCTVTGNNLCGNNNGAFNYHEDIVDNNTIEYNECASRSDEIPGFTVYILLFTGLITLSFTRNIRRIWKK
ncbi:MAG: right-handed parallel beta-helix repeat-containing protein [Candidatus Hodarchaeales archaeon]